MTGTYERGDEVRRQVLGDAHVERAQADSDDFTTDFQNLVTTYAWGAVWARPGLDRRTRRCVTIALLAAGQCEEELAMHVRRALQDDLTSEEIKEVLLQVAVYAGVPYANRAFAVARNAHSAVHP